MTLKVLLAVDGSEYMGIAVKTLKALKLRGKTELTIMTVVPEHTFLGGITLRRIMGDAAARERAHKAQDKRAATLLQESIDLLGAVSMNVETLVARGNPAEQIIGQAHEIHADLVVIGAKGVTNSARFPLGSVAQKVMKYAGTSVLLVREATKRVKRVLLATDGSKYSDAAARFLISLPLPRQGRIILVSSLQSHMAALVRMPTLDIQTNRRILEGLRAAEEEAARSLMAKTVKQFRAKGYEVESFVLHGEPAAEILAVARTLNPDLVAVGAKGLSGIESFLLGSVAQRVARFSRYSVLIVRAPRR